MNNDSNILSHFFNVVKMIKKKWHIFSFFFKKKMFSQPYASPTTILMYKVIVSDGYGYIFLFKKLLHEDLVSFAPF